MRGQLLLDALAENEKIEVADEEVDMRVTDLAARSGKTVGRLKAEMSRDGRLENIVFQLKQDKAVALLIENATVTEKEPEPEADKSADSEDSGSED